MLRLTAENVQSWSELGSRGSFGKAMLDIAENCPDVVVLTADLADATRVREFSHLYPERFFQMGLAEQNMVGVAAGMALTGLNVFATTFAAFASMRVCEQVRTDACYMNLNVKMVGADGGVVMGTLGTTHFGNEDIAVLRGIPNLVILSPSDGASVVKATWAAALHKGPVYLRLAGGKNAPIVYRDEFDFEIGKAITLRDGADASIIATGPMVTRALEASALLAADGIAARVIEMHTIKPLDTEVVRQAAADTGLIVSVEEHSIIGGLGSAIAETMAEEATGAKLVRMGLPDRFGYISNYPVILERYGLTSENIARNVRTSLGIAAEA